MPIALITVDKHRLGLRKISQAEIQAPQFPDKPIIALKLFVGIIRPMLVYHISDKRIIGGRLDTKSSAPMNTTQPHKTALQLIHHCKDTTFSAFSYTSLRFFSHLCSIKL
jgi:hypothetical protein